MATGAGQLVVFGSTGRTLLFSPEELVMPERFADRPWCVKQWEAMRPIWMRRVLSERRLQQLGVGEIIDEMATTLDRRWQQRKDAKKAHNKQRRGKDDAGTAERTEAAEDVKVHAVPDAGPAAPPPDKSVARQPTLRIGNVADAAAMRAERDDIVLDLVGEVQRHCCVTAVRSTIPATHRTERSKNDAAYVDVTLAAQRAVAVAMARMLNGRLFAGRSLECVVLDEEGTA